MLPPPPREGGPTRYSPAFNTVVFETTDVDKPVAGKAFVTDEDGVREIELPEPATYKGKVVGEPNSMVRFTITPDGVGGFVSSDKGYYGIEPVNGYKKTEAWASITHFTYNN